jgi:iron complex transport system permease protein
VIAIALHARELDALLLGEDAALSVGVDVPRVRRDLLLLSALVTAATVAVAGVIGFVGLLVPHVARLTIGPRHGVLLPFAALVGAAGVVVADLGTRTLPASDLRLGVVTSLVGGPFFLFLLTRHRAFGARS